MLELFILEASGWKRLLRHASKDECGAEANSWLILMRSGMVKCRARVERVFKLTTVCAGQRFGLHVGLQYDKDYSERESSQGLQ